MNVYELQTKARKALQRCARTRDVKPMLEMAAKGSRDEEAATLRCLVALAGSVEAWEPAKVSALVIPGGLAAIRPDGEGFTCYHTGPAHEAWGKLLGLGKVNQDDGVWFLEVNEDCEVVASVSRSEF
jgi:hypothetical protein